MASQKSYHGNPFLWGMQQKMKGKTMKKLVMLIAVMFPLAVAHADTAVYPIRATASTTINAKSTGCTVFTDHFDTRGAANYAISFKAQTPVTWANPALTIELEQSYAKPTTENTSDSTWSTVPSTIATNHQSQGWIHRSFTVTPAPYARFKITGETGNSSQTTVQVNVSKQYN